jgi:LmbE family N-acetylglucosaminyl deacetylase
VVAVSPHCDDAVFSCGDFLAAYPGGLVVTIFAGRPADECAVTPWDASAGFATGDDPIGVRRCEDRAALSAIGASPEWLDFRDRQYGQSPSTATVAEAITPFVSEASLVLVPLGLFHSDHRLASDAALAVARGLRPLGCWLAYEDAIYRRMSRLRRERLAQLRAAGLALHPVARPLAPASARKRRAVACYRSQLRALAAAGRPGYEDVFAPERFWRIGLPVRASGRSEAGAAQA